MTTAAAPSDAAGRRARLRQYQAQLLERMQAARSARGARVNQLGVHLGPREAGAAFLLDLTQTGEIGALPPVTAVPLTQPWYLGLANIRGSLIGVIDLGRYLGLGDTPAGPDSRVVTFAPALGFNCALLVARVYGLRHAGAMEAAGEHLLDAEGQSWIPLDLAELAREARFMHVGL